MRHPLSDRRLKGPPQGVPDDLFRLWGSHCGRAPDQRRHGHITLGRPASCTRAPAATNRRRRVTKSRPTTSRPTTPGHNAPRRTAGGPRSDRAPRQSRGASRRAPAPRRHGHITLGRPASCTRAPAATNRRRRVSESRPTTSRPTTPGHDAPRRTAGVPRSDRAPRQSRGAYQNGARRRG